MADQEASGAKYHVLLIGVDHYPGHELQGCVNDVDAVHGVLIGPRMRIPDDQIRCLVSPLPGVKREPVDGEQEASAANIRRELEALGSDAVAAGDRVFIYYCGHGYRTAVKADDGATFHREALVPADFERTAPKAFLYDFDVNRLLHAIARRTTSVTVMLDSCHSDGATREFDDPAEPVMRQLKLGDPEPAPLTDPGGAERARGEDPGDARVAVGVGDCQVVAACLAHQLAREGTYGGQRHGLFTHAFTAALEAAPDGDLRTIAWARVWEAMCATMASHSTDQAPSMTGNAGRAVFGGPPVDGDAGIPVFRDGDRYRLEAGTLADVAEGAELAIYGELPRSFPPLGSDADLQARCGLVRVVPTPTTATAIATAVAPFAWPAAARARLVKAAARLRYAVTPGHPEIQIADSPLLECVDSLAAAAVRLELRGDSLLLTDDEYTIAPDAAVLCELRPDELDVARRVLEHYHAYSRPLRLARRATPGGDGVLRVNVLACGEGIDSAAAQSTRPPEAPRRNGRYELVSGTKVCFRVCNTGADRMRVTLFDVAASGRVQKLGDEIIEGKAEHLFWDTSKLGAPFPMRPARGKPRGIDRLVAIGRTDTTVVLDHLVVETPFSKIVDAMRRGDWRDVGDDDDAPPLDRWAAAVAVVDVGPPKP